MPKKVVQFQFFKYIFIFDPYEIWRCMKYFIIFIKIFNMACSIYKVFVLSSWHSSADQK